MASKLYEYRKVNRLCTWCGVPLAEGNVQLRCEKCRQHMHNYSVERRKRCISRGICPECGEKVLGKDEKTCPVCRARAAEKSSLHYRKKHCKQIGVFTKNVCQIC